MATVAVPRDGIWVAARTIITTLQQSGYETYIAGGAVRDLLLGRPVTDIDVATAARPEVVEAMFPRTIAVGRAFGVIIIPTTDGGQVEVATFRADDCYVDGRRPSAIRFASAAEDVQRRDFTINALLVDPEDGQIHDHVGGLADLHARCLRAVGDAHARLREDRLRVLRGLRFAAHLNMTWDPATWAAVQSTPVIGLSGERVWEEWRKALAPGGSQAHAWARLMITSGHLAECFPTLAGVTALPRMVDLVPGDEEAVRLALWLDPGAPAGAWLTTQPLPRRVVCDAQWLADSRARRTWGADLAAAPAQRLLRCEPRAAMLARYLDLSADPATASAFAEAFTAAHDRGPFQPWVCAADLLGMGVPRGPEVGRILRAVEDAQLAGVVGDRETALIYAKKQGKFSSKHETHGESGGAGD